MSSGIPAPLEVEERLRLAAERIAEAIRHLTPEGLPQMTGHEHWAAAREILQKAAAEVEKAKATWEASKR